MNRLTYSLDQLGSRVPGGIGRYSVELFKQMARKVPNGWEYVGIQPPVVQSEISSGTSQINTRVLPTRLLSRSWSHGLLLGKINGSLHAPSLLAPMSKTVASGKLVVTVHDAVPWTHPETLTEHGVNWHTLMLHRALKYADAVVVPSVAVQQELSELFNFGNRLVVIPGAPSLDLQPPTVEDQQMLNLLPDRFFLTVGTHEPRKGLLFAKEAALLSRTLPLVHIGPRGWGDRQSINTTEGENNFYLELGYVSNNVLAHAYQRAEALVMPSSAEGFGLPLVEAMSLGTPGIISNIDSLKEVGGQGVLLSDPEGPEFAADLAEQMTRISANPQLRSELSMKAILESKRFSWEQSAMKAWELHLNL